MSNQSIGLPLQAATEGDSTSNDPYAKYHPHSEPSAESGCLARTERRRVALVLQWHRWRATNPSASLILEVGSFIWTMVKIIWVVWVTVQLSGVLDRTEQTENRLSTVDVSMDNFHGTETATQASLTSLNLTMQAGSSDLAKLALSVQKQGAQIGALSIGIASINVVTFNATGVYQPSPNMKYCVVRLVGAGGAGGTAPTTVVHGAKGAAGGGAGGYAEGMFTAAQIGVSQSIVVGSGGQPGNPHGGNGQDSSFGSLLYATGGRGGFGAGVTSSDTSMTYQGGAGGCGTVGSLLACGEAGGNGISIVVQPSGSVAIAFFSTSGQGGSSQFGGGGAAIALVGGGQQTESYGAGGSGGAAYEQSAQAFGGPGSSGAVIITEFITPF